MIWRLLALIAVILVPSAARAEAIPVKVVVLTMFEVGGPTGDVAGEFQLWAERWPFTREVSVPGIEAPVRVSDDGVVLVLAGMNARARQSVTALALDPRFDTRRAYWLVAGIAGVDPATGSVGSAAWADWVIEGDSAHEMDDRETPKGWPWGLYARGTRAPGLKGRIGTDSGMVWRLDPGLVDWAFDLTKGVALGDDDRLKAARAGFAEAPGRAAPFVYRGDSLGSARFWHGVGRTAWARDWVKVWTDGQGRFAMTNCEDHQVMDALTLLGPTGRVDPRRALVLRTASNYAHAPPGAPDPVYGGLSGGLSASVEAAWRVGSPVVKALVAGWDRYGQTIPGGRP